MQITCASDILSLRVWLICQSCTQNSGKIYLVIYCKRIRRTQEQPERRDAQGKVSGKGWRFHALFRHITFPAPPCAQQPRSCLNLLFRGFYEGFIILLTWLIKSLATSDRFSLQLLSPPPGEVGGTESFNTNHWLAPLATSSILRGFPKLTSLP